jgi:L-ascorbate metabolism protein UlaG (beta-lactamase superfamily)
MRRFETIAGVTLFSVTALVLAASETPRPTTARPPIVATYIANMGYLVEVGAEKILIDALYTKANANYAAPTAEVLARMERGEPPFDGITVVVATHRHTDHFKAATVASFLRKNPQAVFFGPPQTGRDLEADPASFAAIRQQVRSLPGDVGASAVEKSGGVTIKAFATDHDGGTGRNENVMVLIKVNGRAIFHEGDARIGLAEFARLDLAEEAIDLAILHEWYLTTDEGTRIVRELLKPQHLLVAHVPVRLLADTPGRIEQLRIRFPMTCAFPEPRRKIVFDD